KPHCALCERETAPPQAPPPVPPDPMPPTNRRPREVDTSMHFCPHLGCDYRGWLGMNNLRANGHPNGGLWRQCQCTSCEGYFPEHHGTDNALIYEGLFIFNALGGTLDENANSRSSEGIPCGSKNCSGFLRSFITSFAKTMRSPSRCSWF